MTIDRATLRTLLTPAGAALLARADSLPDLREATLLRALETLRRDVPPALATAAVETVLLRRRAAAKFERAAAMFFTRAALEQSSAAVVAEYRARRFAALGVPRVTDLGCGIGGDSLALAAAVPRVTAVDRDGVRLMMTHRNAEVYGLDHRIDPIQADLRRCGTFAAPAAFFDPARRDASGRRLRHVGAHEPPLQLAATWLERTPAIGIKLSPGIALEELATLGFAAPQDAELEFLSVRGELREAALWLGPLRSTTRRATLLPGGDTLTDTDGGASRPPADGPIDRYLYEPDPAVYRAGLLGALAARLGAHRIDPTIAYLTAGSAVATPFARMWEVDEMLPFGVKTARARLRALGAGRLTVKKRGSPLEPEAFTRMMRPEGSAHRTVFLTRAAGRPVVIIARP